MAQFAVMAIFLGAIFSFATWNMSKKIVNMIDNQNKILDALNHTLIRNADFLQDLSKDIKDIHLARASETTTKTTFTPKK